MIVLNISTVPATRHDVGVTLLERGWCWGDGKTLRENPLVFTFKDNPYIALKPEDKTIRQVITTTKQPPTKMEILAAGYIIIDVLNKKDWVF